MWAKEIVMNIKKIFGFSMVFVLILGLFNMLCFWLMQEYTDSFYVSIGFGNGSILIYAIASALMGRRGKYIYLSAGNALIIGSYTIIAVILNWLFVWCEMNNLKVNLIVNVIILVLYLIFIFYVYASNATATEQEEKLRVEKNKFYDLKVKAEPILNSSSDWNLNKKIESLYDKIASCQINTQGADVSSIDENICNELDKLTVLIDSNVDAESITNKIDAIKKLVDQRNRTITDFIRR